MDLVEGDELVSVNGREPTDIIEYQQLIDGEVVALVVRREGEPLDRKVTVAPVTTIVPSASSTNCPRACDGRST